MKKVYEAPAVEKVEFQYRDQVVVASGDPLLGNQYREPTGAECIYYGQGHADNCSTSVN